MMRTQRLAAALLILLLAGTPSLQAQIPAGRWEKVHALLPGTGIIIRMEAGERLEAAFRAIGTDDITVSEETGAERKVPKSAVRSIETAATVRDPLRNGIGIGALIGAGAGFLLLLAYAKSRTASGPFFDLEEGGVSLGAALVGGGLGAAAGAVVDASIRKHEVLYRAQ